MFTSGYIMLYPTGWIFIRGPLKGDPLCLSGLWGEVTNLEFTMEYFYYKPLLDRS